MSHATSELRSELYAALEPSSRLLPRDLCIKLLQAGLDSSTFEGRIVLNKLGHNFSHHGLACYDADGAAITVTEEFTIREYRDPPQTMMRRMCGMSLSDNYVTVTQTREVPKMLKFKTREPTELHNPTEETLKDLDELRHNILMGCDDYRYISYMKQEFHPAPNLTDILTPERAALLQEICESMGIDYAPMSDCLDLKQVCEAVRARLQLPEPAKFSVRRSRNKKVYTGFGGYAPIHKQTLSAHWSDEDKRKARNRLKKQLRPRSNEVFRMLSALYGSLEKMLEPTASALSLLWDKVGMFFDCTNKDSLATLANDALVFIALFLAELKARKGFTLESQMHGGMDQHLKALYDVVSDKPENILSLALLCPYQSLVQQLDVELRESLAAAWLRRARQLVPLLKVQWHRGVERCAGNGMLVPRSGTSRVNTNLWNAIAGTWSNCVRHVRALLGDDAPFMTKCLKLTAGDQSEWAQIEGKDEDVNVGVFTRLALEYNVMPWTGLLEPERAAEARERVVAVCAEQGVPEWKWLGKPVERVREERVHRDMVCGVCLDVPANAVAELKKLGIFGAKQWNAS